MLTKVYGSAVFGVDATTITVEVNFDIGVGYQFTSLCTVLKAMDVTLEEFFQGFEEE